MTWYGQNPYPYNPTGTSYAPPAAPPYLQGSYPYAGYPQPFQQPPQQPPPPPRPNVLLIVIAILLSLSLIAGLVIAIRNTLAAGQKQPVTQELIDTIADQVSEIRELPWVSKVQWRVVSDDEMRDLLREQQAEITDQGRAETAAVGELIKYLRLFPPDADLLTVFEELVQDTILGFYDPAKDELVVRASPHDIGPLEKATLAHELAHALVDQNFDLEAIRQEISNLDDSERAAAFDALVEGDASLVMVLWASRNLSFADIGRMGEDAVKSGDDALDTAPRIVRKWWEFPYDKGLDFVFAVHQKRGWSSVGDAYKKPPVSTSQILHPDDYLEGRGRQTSDPAGKAGEVPAPPAIEGCETISEGVIGELDLSLTLSEFLDVPKAEAAADGWKADRYRFERCGDRKVFRATILSDSPREAAELKDAWNEWIDGWSTKEGNYPIPSSFVPGVGGGIASGNGFSVSVILADDLAMVERRAA
jgi:hypothetical protein